MSILGFGISYSTFAVYYIKAYTHTFIFEVVNLKNMAVLHNRVSQKELKARLIPGG